MQDGVLHLQLAIVEAAWHPELAGPERRVLAFAEEGHAPSNPGPLIRVREGSTVAVTVTNRAATALTIGGLCDRTQSCARGRCGREWDCHHHISRPRSGHILLLGHRRRALRDADRT